MFLERAFASPRPRSAACLSENSGLRLSALASSLGKRRYGSSTPWNCLTRPRQLIAGSARFARRRWWTWDRLEWWRRAKRLAEVARRRSAEASDRY